VEKKPVRAPENLPHKLIGVCWILTTQCNLKCPKCFALTGLNDGDLQTQKNIVDIIAGDGVKKLTFAGGEPLLVPHCIDLITYAHDKRLKNALFTNGLLLTPKLIEQLDPILDHLSLPLEGSTPEIHERVMGSKKHHNKVLSLLPHVTKKRFNLEVSTVITQQNIDDLANLGNLLATYGVPKWKLFQFYPLGRGLLNNESLSVNSDAFLNATKSIAELFPNIDVDIQVGDEDKQASYFNLDPKGDVYTTIKNKYVLMGNIFKASPIQIWQDPRFRHERHTARHSRDI
jgi:radical S-adenosyl methionine domain-containing protein 2